MSQYGYETLILIKDLKFLHLPLYPDLCPHLTGSSQAHAPSFLQVPWKPFSIFLCNPGDKQTHQQTDLGEKKKTSLAEAIMEAGERAGGAIRSDALWWIYLQGWIFTLSQTTHHLLKVFLKDAHECAGLPSYSGTNKNRLADSWSLKNKTTCTIHGQTAFKNCWKKLTTWHTFIGVRFQLMTVAQDIKVRL